MLGKVLQFLGLAKTATTDEGRSPHWPAVERAHLKAEPTCQVCGTKNDLNAHHVIPFHVDPKRELDASNLMTLCRPHHLLIGHLMNWRSWNKQCRLDAQTWRHKISERP